MNPIKVIDNLNTEKLFDVNTNDARPQPLQQKKANQMSFLESEFKTDHSLSTTESEVDTEQEQVNKKQHQNNNFYGSVCVRGTRACGVHDVSESLVVAVVPEFVVLVQQAITTVQDEICCWQLMVVVFNTTTGIMLKISRCEKRLTVMKM